MALKPSMKSFIKSFRIITLNIRGWHTIKKIKIKKNHTIKKSKILHSLVILYLASF